jgi:hypothetical protein
MPHRAPTVAGELRSWPTKERMTQILRDSGLRVTVGQYSIRIDDCSHFVFQEYGGDLGEPSVDADADSGADLLRDAQRVSSALSHAGVVHRFEVYDEQDALVGYFHHDWPQTDVA